MFVADIKTPISSVNGIGPQMSKTLSKINIFTVGDLLQYFPRDYEDRSAKVWLKDFNHQKVNTVARVLSHEWFGFGSAKTLKIIITDYTTQAELVCFNRGFLEKMLPIGSVISVNGIFSVKFNKIQSSSFEVEKMKFDFTSSEFIDNPKKVLQDLQPLNIGIIPIYSLTEGLTQKTIKKIISTVIKQYVHGIDDEIPKELIQRRNLLSKQDAIRLIHQPQNIQQINDARTTLVYEELYKFQSIILNRCFYRKGKIEKIAEQNVENQKKINEDEFINSLSPLQLQLLQNLPFKLTNDQESVIFESDEEIDRSYQEREKILNDLDKGIKVQQKSAFSMSRLIQGDVGSGKTLVSLFIALRIISWKGQCAFLAPTEILARQHAQTVANLVNNLGIRVAFLTGNVKSKGRIQILKALKDGEIDIIVGTHALFSSNVIYKDLRLAIIDEQHRFGVLQRQSIIEKGRKTEHNFTFEPNLLMMSATPIPQSLALTIFGDLDISTIKAKPIGRKEIKTFLVKEGNETNAYEAVRKELEQGHQAYFVYPAIDSDENIKSAQKAFENLSQNVFPSYKCALLHSKVEEELQVQILQDFRDNSIQILAATTVIEVGVDVPNATCIVIEQADRFGLSQLHQLRGRVGRGELQSFCFLIYSKNITEIGIERMKALRQSTDGFYIAEQDLKTRGPGEITGTVQAGALEFKIADISRDMEIMIIARDDVASFLCEE